jgi:5'' nucleotidase, deoxy (Pyrimidine), cytosolic type C protein (NT5C).
MDIVLGLDIDGVVLNYGPALLEYGVSRGLKIGCEWHEVDMYNMSKAFPDLDTAGIMNLITEFSEAEGFSRIREMEGFSEALAAIRAAYPELKLIAITSAGVSETTINSRKKNLEQFGFNEVHVLPLQASKEEHLAQLPKGSVFVDDLKKHVASAEKVGLTGILMRQPYNSADTHDLVIHNWKEGAEVIKSVLSQNLKAAA